MSELTLVTEIAWGMLGDAEPSASVKRVIESEKQYVAQMLCYLGFQVTSQVFEYDSEWGQLVTRAKLVRPGTTYTSGAQYGDFYNPRIVDAGQKRYLDITGLKPDESDNGP